MVYLVNVRMHNVITEISTYAVVLGAANILIASSKLGQNTCSYSNV